MNEIKIENKPPSTQPSQGSQLHQKITSQIIAIEGVIGRIKRNKKENIPARLKNLTEKVSLLKRSCEQEEQLYISVANAYSSSVTQNAKQKKVINALCEDDNAQQEIEQLRESLKAEKEKNNTIRTRIKELSLNLMQEKKFSQNTLKTIVSSIDSYNVDKDLKEEIHQQNAELVKENNKLKESISTTSHRINKVSKQYQKLIRQYRALKKKLKTPESNPRHPSFIQLQNKKASKLPKINKK